MPGFAARTTGFEGEIVDMPLKSSYCQTGFDPKNNLSPMSTTRIPNRRRFSICPTGSSLLLLAADVGITALRCRAPTTAARAAADLVLTDEVSS